MYVIINFLYLIFNKTIGYFKEINGNKYLTLVLTDKSKKRMKRQEELRSEIRYLIRSKIDNTDDYHEKYMKIKFNSDDDLSLNKMLQLCSMIIFVRAVFHKNNKYYSQVFLDECLYKLSMLYYDKTDVSEGIDINRISESNE